MNSKSFLILGGAVLILLGLMVFGQRNQGPSPSPVNNSPSPLVANESSFDFGTISMRDGKVRKTISVQNSGESAISLSRLYTSCMCTTVVWKKGERELGPFGMPGHGFVPPLNQELLAGETAELEIEFDPTAHGPAGVGPISRGIYLDNDAGLPFQVAFKAVVTP